MLVPSPSCPQQLFPQHLTPPWLVSAQELPPPVEIAVTPPERPETSTGLLRITVVPSPTWPLKLAPQHLAEAAVVTAHVTALAAEIAAAPLPRPATARGPWRSVHVPSPTSPLAFAPQHLALPATVTAQACVTPAVMAVALADAGGSREAAAPEQTTTASAPRTRTGDPNRVRCRITLPSATPKLHFLHWGMPSRQEPGCNAPRLSLPRDV